MVKSFHIQIHFIIYAVSLTENLFHASTGGGMEIFMIFLDQDNFIHTFLNKLGDIIIANMLFIFFSVPLITIGPALTALYHCMLRTVKGNNNGTIKTFLRAFKDNFIQSLIIWLLIAMVSLLLIGNNQFLAGIPDGFAQIFLYLTRFVMFLLGTFTLYIFPVIAAFSNKLILLAKNALILAFIHFPTTLIMGSTFVLPMYITYVDLKLQPLYVCCWFFFGFGLIAYVHSLLLYRIFKKLLPPEDGK